MMIRLLKHMTIGGTYHFMGTMLPLSVLDKIMDDGRLVYHYAQDKFDIIPADMYKVVYSSYKEMEEELAKKKKKEE